MALDAAGGGRRINLRDCGGPTTAPALCPQCVGAFALARRAHPSAAGFGTSLTPISDDLDMWDAWSLLGDVGTALSER